MQLMNEKIMMRMGSNMNMHNFVCKALCEMINMRDWCADEIVHQLMNQDSSICSRKFIHISLKNTNQQLINEQDLDLHQIEVIDQTEKQNATKATNNPPDNNIQATVNLINDGLTSD